MTQLLGHCLATTRWVISTIVWVILTISWFIECTQHLVIFSMTQCLVAEYKFDPALGQKFKLRQTPKRPPTEGTNSLYIS